MSLSGTLSDLSLADNKFSGPIPPSLSAISGLRFLNLSNNIFNETFPSKLSLFQNLEDLCNNNMIGVLPLAITQMSNLRHLHLGGNFFSDQIPPEYGQWRNLEYLAVSDNELDGVIPPEIENLSNLREIYIRYYNTYAGGIPSKIGNMTELVRLDIDLLRIISRDFNETGEASNITIL